MSCYTRSRQPWGWKIPDCNTCGALPDWDFLDCDLQPGDELRDAVIASLFGHAKDAERQSPKGGWWAQDLIEPATGSRLWTLQGSPVNDDYVVRAERYARESLEWLRNIGAIASLRVFGDIVDGTPKISIELYGQSGDVIYADEFERLWHG